MSDEDEWGFAEADERTVKDEPVEDPWEYDYKGSEAMLKKLAENKKLTSQDIKTLIKTARQTLPAGLTVTPSDILGTILGYLPQESELMDLKYIAGPVTLTKHVHPKMGKTFYVFGDWHILESKCPVDSNKSNTLPIEKFIEQLLIEYPDKIFDLFVEINYEKTLGISYISDVSKQFENCFYDNKKCEYPNLRAHWTDFRHTEQLYGVKTKDLTIVDLCYRISQLYHQINRNRDDLVKLEEIRKDLFNFMDILPAKAWDPALILNNPVIKKQLDNIKSLNIKTYLIASFLERSQKSSNNLWFLQKADSKEYQLISSEGQEFCVATMDLYLMARLFREFKSKRAGEYSQSASNVIIFAGDYHAQYYRDALEMLGFKTIKSIQSPSEKGKYYQCLNVTGFYPWF